MKITRIIMSFNLSLAIFLTGCASPDVRRMYDGTTPNPQEALIKRQNRSVHVFKVDGQMVSDFGQAVFGDGPAAIGVAPGRRSVWVRYSPPMYSTIRKHFCLDATPSGRYLARADVISATYGGENVRIWIEDEKTGQSAAQAIEKCD